MGYSSIFIILVFVVLLFFMQRQQRKQRQQRQETLNAITKGTEVITIGGLYGVIDEVDKEKNTVTLDIEGVYLTFERSAIKTVLPTKAKTDLVDGKTDSAIEE